MTLSILTIITTQSEMSQIHAYLYVGFTGSGKRGCVRDVARDEISRGEVSRDFHRRPTGLVDNRRLLATRRDVNGRRVYHRRDERLMTNDGQ